MLTVQAEDGEGLQYFVCKACPYRWPITENKLYVEQERFARKEKDDVMGETQDWSNVDTATIDCPKGCGAEKAYFYQMQIRSADEPMTTFYKCINCDHKWKEN